MFLILLVQRRSQISTTVKGNIEWGKQTVTLWTAIEFYVIF